MKYMNEKTNQIVDAAIVMFGRYGFSKTTMGDIATQAGVSRQTVYNAFPGKEEILRASVRKYGETVVQDVTTHWDAATSFEDKIDLFHTHVPIKWFENMQASPEWTDLMEGMHKAAADEIKAIDTTWRATLTDVFEAELSGTTKDGRSATEIVDFFYNASVNAKHGATDIDHLRKRLDTVKAATLGLIR